MLDRDQIENWRTQCGFGAIFSPEVDMEFDPIKVLRSNGPKSQSWKIADLIVWQRMKIESLVSEIEKSRDVSMREVLIAEARDTLRKLGAE